MSVALVIQHAGAPLGNLEGGSSTRDFERWIKRALGMESLSLSLSEEAQCRGPLGRTPLLGTLKDMLSKALEWASVSTGALLLRNMEGCSLLRAFEINRYEVCPESNEPYLISREPVA
jgi:hypothetical protein